MNSCLKKQTNKDIIGPDREKDYWTNVKQINNYGSGLPDFIPLCKKKVSKLK